VAELELAEAMDPHLWGLTLLAAGLPHRMLARMVRRTEDGTDAHDHPCQVNRPHGLPAPTTPSAMKGRTPSKA
jgi:hypothetical protein